MRAFAAWLGGTLPIFRSQNSQVLVGPRDFDVRDHVRLPVHPDCGIRIGECLVVKDLARIPIRFARGDNGSVHLGHEKVTPLFVIKHTPANQENSIRSFRHSAKPQTDDSATDEIIFAQRRIEYPPC